jgi:uncharacterized protein (TIGR03437 family)
LLRLTYLTFGLAILFGVTCAVAQVDYSIVTARPTKPSLNSLRLLADGAVVYSDAYGVFRVRGQQTDTLLTNPVQETYCIGRMFNICFGWVPAVYHPKPMTVDADGAVYIADPEQHLIQRYDTASKEFVTLARDAGAPTSLVADDRGGLYFTDPERCRVRKVSQGTVTTVAGTGICGYSGDGSLSTNAEILSVHAIALDATGQLLIADDKAGVVRRVDRDGVIMTIAGTGIPSNGGEGTAANRTPLNGVGGLAIDSPGNLFLSESRGNRIRVVTPDGLIRTVAGTGATGTTGDYGPARSAQLTSPGCLAVSESGALWACDSDRLRKLIPDVPGRWNLPVLSLATPEVFPRVSPGSWLTVLGDFAGLPAIDWSNAIVDGTLPTSLAGVTADVSGNRCVIAYVSPDRLDLLLPTNLTPGYFPQVLQLRWPGGASEFKILIPPSSPAFLTTSRDGRQYAAAATQDRFWITPDRPARPGETIALYVTGISLTSAIAPPYDVREPNAMQLVVRSRGYPVRSARPLSPGVVELTVTLPTDLAPGDASVSVVYEGTLATGLTVLPIGTGQ